MSFGTQEESKSGRSPREFYKFIVGDTTYRYTAGPVPLTLSDVLNPDADGEYLPTSIECGPVAHEREAGASRITITVPRDNPIAVLFIQFIPDIAISAFVYRRHETDEFERVVTWVTGTVRQCEFKESKAFLTIETPKAKLQRLGLYQKYQLVCQLATYSPRCGVDREDFKDTGTVAAIDGLVVTITGLAHEADENWYTGGYILTPAGSHRFIEAHDGDELTLMLTASDLEVGQVVDVFAGDDHTHTTCRTKFFPAGDPDNPDGNIENHFGFFTSPGRNPFTQGGL